METSMGVSITQQVNLFLGAGLVGIALGAVYDVFRILRLAVKPFMVVVLIEDLLFFFLFTAATFFYMLLYNNGHVRLFVIIGELIGFTLYYFTVGMLVMGISKAIIRFIKWLLRWLYKIFIWPFVRLFQLIAGLMVKMLGGLKKIVKKPLVKTKIGLKRQRQILYNLLKTPKVKKDKKQKESKRKK